MATNQEIGEKFGLTYSAVRQRVIVIKETFNNDKGLERKYQQIKSLIKILHRNFMLLISFQSNVSV